MERVRYLAEIKAQLGVHPICGILGPRQVGKTTLARQYVELYHDKKAYFLILKIPWILRDLKIPSILLNVLKKI
jgi:predicted AAA+ superfamily ATPase